MRHVAGIEVVNGSTPTRGIDGPGWVFWADRLNRGERAVAVGGSDVHDPIGGRASLGRPATVVWAAALSEPAIVEGLKSGRVFVRATANSAAFVDLVAISGELSASMGQSVAPGHLSLTTHIKNAKGQQCRWIRRGRVVASEDVLSDDHTSTLAADAVSGDWFSVIVSRDRQPQLISNAVFVRD